MHIKAQDKVITSGKKLADQEPDVERLQKSIKELTQRATREQQEIDNYLNTLNVE